MEALTSDYVKYTGDEDGGVMETRGGRWWQPRSSVPILEGKYTYMSSVMVRVLKMVVMVAARAEMVVAVVINISQFWKLKKMIVYSIEEKRVERN